MGFTFRKTIGTKNLRLNLSKSGPTISTGVKGLRVVSRHKGGARLYAHKKVAGVQLRYIKTVSLKKGKTNKIKHKTGISMASKKKYCENCGKSIDLDSNFCENCGAKQ